MTVPSSGHHTSMKRLALLLVLFPAMVQAADVWTTPFTGVRRLVRTETSPNNLKVHVLEIDLDAPGVYLGSTKSAERQRTPSSYAKLVGAKAAVNGDFFNYTGYATSGLAAGGGVAWADTADNSTHGVLAFNQDAGASRVELYTPSSVTPFASWMKGAVSGHPRVLGAGTVPTSFTAWGSLCTSRHPRTAVGYSQDKRTLYLAVVDGRTTASVGMTCSELGVLMKGLGAYTAMNLDGGGSSAMYVTGAGVVNAPSDGNERVVANHLAVYANVPGQTGIVRGVVYQADAGPIETAPRIPGATVNLSNGMKDIADSAGNWDFTVPPGQYTATATAPGYTPNSVTRTVTNGGTIYGSIALLKSAAPVDFDGDGVPDSTDNCDSVDNPGQANLDGDAFGDRCDLDDDGDGLADEDDNCPRDANPGQADTDGDGEGDVCDGDPLDAGPQPMDDGGVADPEEDAGVEPIEDAGVEPPADAGTVVDDGGTAPVDGGVSPLDAGVLADGGRPDGELPDAGGAVAIDDETLPGDPEPTVDAVGCSAAGATPLLGIALGALLVLGTRRRRSR